MPNRIPHMPSVTPPLRLDHVGTLVEANGGRMGFAQLQHIVDVFNAYYADQPGRESVPQFVVVNWNDGDEENEMGVATCDISEIGDVVRLRNGREIPIVEAEYDRLKSILAPGQ